MQKEENGNPLGEGIGSVLKLMIAQLLADWEKAALKTPTPVDDFIVKLLRAILG